MSRWIKMIPLVLLAAVVGYLLAVMVIPRGSDKPAGTTPTLIVTQTLVASGPDDPPRIVPWSAVESDALADGNHRDGEFRRNVEGCTSFLGKLEAQVVQTDRAFVGER
jgi:hypothetical protein